MHFFDKKMLQSVFFFHFYTVFMFNIPKFKKQNDL